MAMAYGSPPPTYPGVYGAYVKFNVRSDEDGDILRLLEPLCEYGETAIQCLHRLLRERNNHVLLLQTLARRVSCHHPDANPL